MNIAIYITQRERRRKKESERKISRRRQKVINVINGKEDTKRREGERKIIGTHLYRKRE